MSARNRCSFIGGSDARIIMGDDQGALIRLWREKRGEVGPEDLSGVLVVQLGTATEDLNRCWYERNTGHSVGSVQKWVQHPVHRWMAATLDGLVETDGAVFEAKFMLPWTFSEEAAAEKHMAQLQHNMWVVSAHTAVLDHHRRREVGPDRRRGGSAVPAPPPNSRKEVLELRGERGGAPAVFGVEAPRPRLEAVRIVDMSTSNTWAEFAATYRRTRQAYQDHEGAKADLKKLVPEDAREAVGHGLRAKRSKSGAISFDLLEVADAPLQ
jgi:hypothetical protein